MIFKGYKFRKNANICVIPSTSNNLSFGRIIPQTNVIPLKAIRVPNMKWSDGSPVFANEIKLTGHSLTNMAYGDDYRVYLARDGKCFTAIRSQMKEYLAARNW